jgi:hypothetical protein
LQTKYKLIKQIDLDAELPNILSSNQVKYSLSQKQDAELLGKITDTQNTQTCGLFHIKKLEPESLAEQPIAATDSSQNMLPAGLGLHLATTTLLETLDPSASFTLPVALDLFASSITPEALDPSAIHSCQRLLTRVQQDHQTCQQALACTQQVPSTCQQLLACTQQVVSIQTRCAVPHNGGK